MCISVVYKIGIVLYCSQILELCDEFVPGDPPEFFFDRNPENFPTILNIYRTGQFHMKEGGCAIVLQKDLEYWIIGIVICSPCHHPPLR